MKHLRNFCLLSITILFIMGCSVFGHTGVEEANYDVLEKQNTFELRHYDSLILVTTPMDTMDNQSGAFGRLFDYISGQNNQEQDIAMTAPVFMDQAEIDNNRSESTTMSFVLPADFSYETAPRPQDPNVQLEKLTDYTVAAITFSGFLNEDTIQTHSQKLQQWINNNGYTVTGPAKAAGYNPPFTLPPLRRNEVLIPVEKPETFK